MARHAATAVVPVDDVALRRRRHRRTPRWRRRRQTLRQTRRQCQFLRRLLVGHVCGPVAGRRAKATTRSQSRWQWRRTKRRLHRCRLPRLTRTPARRTALLTWLVALPTLLTPKPMLTRSTCPCTRGHAPVSFEGGRKQQTPRRGRTCPSTQRHTRRSSRLSVGGRSTRTTCLALRRVRRCWHTSGGRYSRSVTALSPRSACRRRQFATFFDSSGTATTQTTPTTMRTMPRTLQSASTFS
mmetsp:Transcript_11041/g.35046  ORF Transcript_11041/g.35046 Transcript_11041/m.35046 type:complete len:240 (-) Transcript_11041:443-1162(-)